MLSKAAEIYTFPPEAETPEALKARENCLCRFRGPDLECEQKNNRGQVALVKLESYPDLQKKFGRTAIPLGMCSIMHGGQPWIVCPNRLFYTGAKQKLDYAIYERWGFRAGDQIALWREVRIGSKKRGKVFNYNFDYVFRKVVHLERRIYEETPFVVEVMSCSTSGGGVGQQFVQALGGTVVGMQRRRLSVNKRQVLGRMMSQLVAKAEVLHNWGGKTVWIVQDLFWNYINETTGFNMDEFRQDPNGNMLILVRKLVRPDYDPKDPQSHAFQLGLERTLQGWDRIERSEGINAVGRDFVSLLNAPFTPDKQLILRKTNQRQPTAIVTCAA